MERKIHKKIGDRLERLILTLIGKKYIAWMVANVFLTQGYINGETWAMLTVGIFCVDAYSKTKPNVHNHPGVNYDN